MWVKGKAYSEDEFRELRKHEEHFHAVYDGRVGDLPGSSYPSWRNPKPIGPPCKDTDISGTPFEVHQRFKGKPCSLVVEFASGWVTFLNWKSIGVEGINGDEKGLAPSTSQIVSIIQTNFGQDYIRAQSPR